MKKTKLLFSMLVPFFVFSQNITNITPNQAMQGQAIPLIISGNNMSFSGWSCWSNTGNLSDFRFSQWSGMNMLYGTPTSATTTQLDGNLSIPAFQPIGIYNLEVFDCLTSGWIQFPNSFQISAPATASWNCINGACIDPGTGNGTYSLLTDCQINCIVVTPTWNCEPSTGICSDPGTGNGTYASLSACQSNCIQTSVHVEGVGSLMIYPNPTDQIVNIQFSTRVKQSIKIRLISTISEIVFVENLQNYSGKYSKEINLEGYSKGIYFLEIETNDEIINKKLILQ
jgi:hypothetical protein